VGGEGRKGGELTSLELILLLDGVRVGRSLGGVDKLISEANDSRKRKGRGQFGLGTKSEEAELEGRKGREGARLTTRRWT